MALGTWADEIAKITGSREFQTARVKITDPSAFDPDDYDVITGTHGNETEAVVYEGQARVNPVRAPQENIPRYSTNVYTYRAIRVQLPQGEVPDIKRGMRVFFVETPGNPALQGKMATVSSDNQGASAATRTLECNLDSDTRTAEDDG